VSVAPGIVVRTTPPRRGGRHGATGQPDHARGPRPRAGANLLRGARMVRPRRRERRRRVLSGRRLGGGPVGSGKPCGGQRGDRRRRLGRGHARLQRPSACGGRCGDRGGARGRGSDRAGAGEDVLGRLLGSLRGSRRPPLGGRAQPGVDRDRRRLDHALNDSRRVGRTQEAPRSVGPAGPPPLLLASRPSLASLGRSRAAS
jgi:hypothetical protein